MSERPSLFVRVGSLSLAAVIIVIDQISKALVASHIPIGTVGWSWGGDFFYLMHQRNTGVAFSLGNALPEAFRHILFIAIPVVVLVALGVYIWRDRALTSWQRWGLGLIMGGGLGNILDRVFRPGGVVDFLSFKFYGFLGMDRFATFNFADSCITVGGAIIILTFIFRRRKA